MGQYDLILELRICLDSQVISSLVVLTGNKVVL